MSGLVDNHPLSHDLPEFKAEIHALKTGDVRFAKGLDAYEVLDKEIVRIEQGIELRTDDELDALKMRRVQMKDELVRALRATKEGPDSGTI